MYVRDLFRKIGKGGGGGGGGDKVIVMKKLGGGGKGSARNSVPASAVWGHAPPEN